MSSWEAGDLTLPLRPGPLGEHVVPDGLQVTGVHVDEAGLAVTLFTVYPVPASMMRRAVSAVTTGGRWVGARHLWTLVRLGQPFHYVMEDETA